MPGYAFRRLFMLCTTSNCPVLHKWFLMFADTAARCDYCHSCSREEEQLRQTGSTTPPFSTRPSGATSTRRPPTSPGCQRRRWPSSGASWTTLQCAARTFPGQSKTGSSAASAGGSSTSLKRTALTSPCPFRSVLSRLSRSDAQGC